MSASVARGSDRFMVATPHADGFYDVQADELSALACDARIVDVREPEEFVGPLGHVRGAELIPLNAIGARARAWNRHAPVVLVCRSGGRSARAAARLAQLGFTRIGNLAGGMVVWNDRGLPVERDDRPPAEVVRDEMLECYAQMHAGTTSRPEAEFREVFDQLGVSFEAPSPAALKRVVHVLERRSLAEGTDPSVVAAHVDKFVRLIERTRE